jgi:hypothetical protein
MRTISLLISVPYSALVTPPKYVISWGKLIFCTRGANQHGSLMRMNSDNMLKEWSNASKCNTYSSDIKQNRVGGFCVVLDSRKAVVNNVSYFH